MAQESNLKPIVLDGVEYIDIDGELFMANVTFNQYMPTIWNRLMSAIGNEYGVAGLMGNLYAESGCTPYACQPSRPYNICMIYIANVDNRTISEYNFVHYGCSSTGGVATSQLGYGLAQWTFYSRKQNLYTYMFSNGTSIGNLENQIDFLIQELQTTYPSVWNTLLSATDVRTASNSVLFDFENPANQGINVQDLRASYGTQIYNEYTGTTPIEPPVDPPTPSPVDPPTPKVMKFTKMPIWMYPNIRR